MALRNRSTTLGLVLCLLPSLTGAQGQTGEETHCPAPLIVDGHTHWGFDLDEAERVSTPTLGYIEERGLDAFGYVMPVQRNGVSDLPTSLANEVGQLEALSRRTGRFRLVKTADGVRRACQEGLSAAFLTLEYFDGIFSGDPGRVAQFKELGIMAITLVNNEHDPLLDRKEYSAELTPLGREVISAMNREGVLVDISHLWPQEMMAVIEASTAPVIASHSNPNLTSPPISPLFDEVARALSAKGGMILLSFNTTSLFREDEDRSLGVKRFLDQVDRLADLVDIEDLGIGTDLQAEGQYVPEALGRPSAFDEIMEGLAERGYTPGQIQGVMGGNLLRFLPFRQP